MHNSRGNAAVLLISAGTLLVMGIASTAVPAAATSSDCDHQSLADTKAHFEDLRRVYLADAASVDESQFRLAALEYMAAAQSCYNQMDDQHSGQTIDEGGLFLNGNGVSTEFGVGEHVLFGTKWGANSPHTGGQDVTGPQSAGGTVTYSFMPNSVNLSAESALPSTAIEDLVTYSPCFLQEIELALAAWSAVSNIQFVPVTDGAGPFNSEANGNIRIGAHAFDGPSGTLAHAFFPPPNGVTAAGDTHFDIDEAWACSPGPAAIDIGIVALHEFGHAIGLDHELTDVAVMNPFYNSAQISGLLADDIIGAGEMYGSSGSATQTFFGNVGIGTDKPAQRLHVKDGELLIEESAPATDSVINFKTAASTWEIKQNGQTGRLTFFSPGGGASTASFKFDRQAQENLLRVGVLGADRVDISGKLVINGTEVTPDYVFSPEYKLETIDEHSRIMWEARHLPGLTSATQNDSDGVDIVRHQFGVLEELEKAHIYIEQLHVRIRDLEQDQQRLANIEQRIQLLEASAK